MTTKITRDMLESYLHCKFKGYLKLAGQQGTKGDFEAMLAELQAEVRLQAIEVIIARHPGDQVARNIALTTANLKRGPQYILDGTFEDDSVALHCDGLKRAEGASKLGDFHYLPVLFHQGRQVKKEQKLLLEVYGMILSDLQGRAPAYGVVWHGRECKATRVKLNPGHRKAEQVLRDLREMAGAASLPRLLLNNHCQVCEFRQRCRTQAEQVDDISLLGGMGEKEVLRYHRKGIFTLTQLSCTFRPRKKGKRVKRPGSTRYSALQALAIREKKIHVYGTPDLPRKPIQVFLDAEGNEDGSFAYLLGVIVGEGDTQKSYSFWADGPEQEIEAFDAFLDLLDSYEDFVLFHYGSYEKALLRRMRKVVRRKRLVDRALVKAVNVLSVIHASVYFPTFSNGLKDVGCYLGCTWTEGDASGLQSLVWRARWEQTREPIWKEKLLTYNAEDCAALRLVTKCVQAIGDAARRRGEGTEGTMPDVALAWADEVVVPLSRREWCTTKFALEEFDFVNRCAYFDYQREKVFFRTSKAVRRACKLHPKRKKRMKLLPTREIEIRSRTCPSCKGKRIIRLDDKRHCKVVYDLKCTAGGIRRQVIRCTAVCHQCGDCCLRFLPNKYKRLDKYLHGLKSWAMYQHIVHRISLPHLESMFEECFGLRVHGVELHAMKFMMARRYSTTWKRILARIVAGVLAHADETHVNLQKGKGYVWALTNLEDVVYMYKPSREAGFLQELLGDFKGVLISDFYSGYDSLDCPQQKCLIHLMRDFNDDLMSHPYDGEFKALAARFGKLLQSIVYTIDKYGLKKRHLHKHKTAVARFFRELTACVYRSDLAEGYRQRLVKSEGKLFTFLDHDGVPWNNNNAEHAVKVFAYYRRITDGRVKADGLSAYLVLLSVYQTCHYRGVSFLKFLLSGEDDIETYCQRGRRKKRPPGLGVYPKGFPRMYSKQPRKGKGKGIDGGEGPRRVQWKLEILAFLSARSETGAGRRDITEYCLGLIRAGTLVTAAPADDRPRVDGIVYMYLCAMKKAGEVVRAPGKIYFATVRGLAWLERHPAPVTLIRQPDEPAPGG